MNTSGIFLSDPIPYRSYFIEQPYLILNSNCIVSGLDISGSILDSNSNLIQITIDPGELILSNLPIFIEKSCNLTLNISSYFDSNPLCLFCHFNISQSIYQSFLQYRVAYLSSDNTLLPSIQYEKNTDTDIIEYSVSILLEGFIFKKENGILIDLQKITNRDDLNTYYNSKFYEINGRSFELSPFDRLTDRTALLIYTKTGGTGETGGRGQDILETGGTGNTAGTGGTGSIAGETRKSQLRCYIHHQCDESSLWIVNHHFNQKYVFVSVYDIFHRKIEPQKIILESYSYCRIYFDCPISGHVLVLAGPVLKTDMSNFVQNLNSFKKLHCELYKGDVGESGIRGRIGFTGREGNPGCDGIDGNPGKTGLRGYTGKIGEVGKRGCTGPIGPVGDSGESGKTTLYGGIGGTGGTGGTGKIGGTGHQGNIGTPIKIAGIGGTGGSGPTGGTGPRGQNGEKGIIGLTGQPGGTGREFLKIHQYSDLLKAIFKDFYYDDLTGPIGDFGISNPVIIEKTESFTFPEDADSYYYYFIHERPMDIVRLMNFEHPYVGTTPPGPQYARRVFNQLIDSDTDHIAKVNNKYYVYNFHASIRKSDFNYDTSNNLLDAYDPVIKFHFSEPIGNIEEQPLKTNFFEFYINTGKNVEYQNQYDEEPSLIREFISFTVDKSNCEIDNSENAIVVNIPYDLSPYVGCPLYCVQFTVKITNLIGQSITPIDIDPNWKIWMYFGSDYDIISGHSKYTPMDVLPNSKSITYRVRNLLTDEIQYISSDSSYAGNHTYFAREVYAAFSLSKFPSRAMYGIENLFRQENLNPFNFKIPLNVFNSMHINQFDHIDINKALKNQTIQAYSKYDSTENIIKKTGYHPVLNGFYVKNNSD